MIEWFTVVQAVLALSGTAVALVAALRGKAASDSTVVPAVVSAGLLVVQILVAAVSPLWGNNPVSDPLEFWMYLITDAMLMPAAIVFALADKTRWANYGIALVSFANAVMLYRMDVLWNGH